MVVLATAAVAAVTVATKATATPKPMKFFIPRTHGTGAEVVYQGIMDSLKSQFRLPIQEHRIYRLRYVNSKKKWHAQVGQLEEHENQYEIVAIFESKLYMIFTRSKTGASGPIILVDKDEVTEIEDFEERVPKTVGPPAEVQ